MVVRLLPPKCHARPPEQQVRGPRRSSFDPLCDLRKGNLRQQEYMHVIWHDRPSDEFIERLFARAFYDCFGNHVCHSRITKPSRSSSPIESAVLRHKCMSRSRIDDVRLCGGQRSMKPPSHKEVSVIRLKMWQPSSVLSHTILVPGELKILVFGGVCFSLRIFGAS
jgi:hypothetical protein